MYKYIFIIFIVVCSSLLTSACTDQKVIEELGLIQIIGYDLEESDVIEDLDKIRVTYSMPAVEHKVEQTNEVLTTFTINNSKEARIILSRRTDRDIVVGQVKSILYQDKIAEKGLADMLDTLERDPALGERVKLNVVEGRSFDILNTNYAEYPRIGKYMDLLLEKESRLNMIPVTNVYQFYRDLLDDGIDPVTPLIKLGEGEVIVDEVALFQDDRYVTKLEPKETLIFSFLRQDYRGGSIMIDMRKVSNDEDIVMFSSLESRRKIEVNKGHTVPKEINIEIKVDGIILEYIGDLDLRHEEDQIILEKRMETYIEKNASDMLSNMQKFQVDSIGIGRRVRNSMSFEEWNNLDWREVLSSLDIKVTVNVNIRNYGMNF